MNYEEIYRKFELLKKIIQPTGTYALDINLERIEKIIKEDIPRTFEQNPPNDFTKLYSEFVGEYERFHDFILFDKLIGKNVVALGGGFKSGKSTFLNNFILGGIKILPTGIDPSTSVPAYIIHQQEQMIFGINVFNAKVKLQIQDIKIISHKFNDPEDESMGQLSLGHVLKSIFIAVPNQQYANIAFMDTPGYSNAESENYSDKTKEQTQYLHLNSSNYIFWFVSASLGTISNDDLAFLSKLRKGIPLVIILNKADKRKDEINAVKDKIRGILDSKGIQYEDILSFSSRSPREYDSIKIQAYLNQWNKRIYETNFARNFKVLFVKCKDYYEKMIDLEHKKLKLINDVIGYTHDERMKERLITLQKESLEHKKFIEATEIELTKLQDDFFSEINLVAGKVGIKMPEPSEIALLQDRMCNPFEILNKYKAKHNIVSNTENIVSMLENTFYNVDSVFNKQMGGSEYLNVLVEAMGDNLVMKKEIHFNKEITYEDIVRDSK